MKKIIFIFSVLVLSVSCKSEPTVPEDTYLINVTAKGLHNGVRAHITSLDKRKKEVIHETAMIVDEGFTFNGEVTVPSIKHLRINSIQKKLPFILEEGLLNIEINKDDIENSVILNSKNNDEFKVYLAELMTKGKQVSEYRTQIGQARKDGNTELSNSLRKEYNESMRAVNSYPYDYVDNHLDSDFSLILLESMLSTSKPDVKRIKASLEKMQPVVNRNKGNKFIGVKLDNYIKQNSKNDLFAIGNVAPDFSGPSPTGEVIKLSNIKGKVTLIDFWASWCKPCRLENPNVVKAYEKFHDKGLEIISVSLDRPGKKDDWLNAIKADNLQWHHVSNLQYWNEPIAHKYNVRSIPAAFLIDADGKIIGKKLRGAALENKIAEYLK